MICMKCGQMNPDSLNFCQKCNATLMKVAPTGASSSVIDVEEGKEYLTPQKSYPTEFLYNLTCRAYEYIHHGASGDPLLEAYDVVRTRLEEFENEALPTILEHMQFERQEYPEDDYARQMLYLLNKGVALYREGCAMMDEFIETGETPTLIEAVRRMQDGNDNLGLATELCSLRGEMLDEELRRCEVQERVEQQQAGATAAASPARAAEGVGPASAL